MLTEKFKAIAENELKVFEAGYKKGMDFAGDIQEQIDEIKADTEEIKENVYDKTQVNDLIAASHMVNITKMHKDGYFDENTIQEIELGAPGRGARYLVWVGEGINRKLFYYTYNPDLQKGNQWEKGYQIKGSTLYLNLEDSCMYRYTNSGTTTPYPHFIKMTISPADIEKEFDDVVSSVDGKIAELVNSTAETLDTLKELAEALEDNEDVVGALNEAIGKKANASDVELLGAEVAKKANASEVELLEAEVERELAKKADKTALAAVATSGNYADLAGTPTTEEWTFTLEDGKTTVTKKVCVK